MRKVVTTATVADTTVLLVRMGLAELRSWNWIGDDLKHPMEGYEVRDVTGALLGVFLTVGHLTGWIHAEYYDPAADDFFSAGDCQQIRTQGIARVLEFHRRHVGPVPSGEGFRLDEPRYLPYRLACLTGQCPEHCEDCEADYQRNEADRLAWAAA